jgi:hypothetical protein
VQPEGTPQPQPQPQATQPDAPLPPSAFCDQLSEVADVVKGAPLKEPMPIPKAKQRTVRQILHGLLHTGVESALLGPWVRRSPIDISLLPCMRAASMIQRGDAPRDSLPDLANLLDTFAPEEIEPEQRQSLHVCFTRLGQLVPELAGVSGPWADWYARLRTAMGSPLTANAAASPLQPAGAAAPGPRLSQPAAAASAAQPARLPRTSFGFVERIAADFEVMGQHHRDATQLVEQLGAALAACEAHSSNKEVLAILWRLRVQKASLESKKTGPAGADAIMGQLRELHAAMIMGSGSGTPEEINARHQQLLPAIQQQLADPCVAECKALLQAFRQQQQLREQAATHEALQRRLALEVATVAARAGRQLSLPVWGDSTGAVAPIVSALVSSLRFGRDQRPLLEQLKMQVPTQALPVTATPEIALQLLVRVSCTLTFVSTRQCFLCRCCLGRRGHLGIRCLSSSPPLASQCAPSYHSSSSSRYGSSSVWHRSILWAPCCCLWSFSRGGGLGTWCRRHRRMPQCLPVARRGEPKRRRRPPRPRPARDRRPCLPIARPSF